MAASLAFACEAACGRLRMALQKRNFIAIASCVSTEGLKQAISDGKAALGACSKMTSKTIMQGSQVHLQSPVVTGDLIQQFSGISRQHAAQAAILAAHSSKQMALDLIKLRNRYSLR